MSDFSRYCSDTNMASSESSLDDEGQLPQVDGSAVDLVESAAVDHGIVDFKHDSSEVPELCAFVGPKSI